MLLDHTHPHATETDQMKASRKNFRDNLLYRNPQKNPNEQWHAEYVQLLLLYIKERCSNNSCLASISFETIPADYASLKIEQLPEDLGGDTLFASGYDAYDRLSPSWKQFLETLSVTHYQVSRIPPLTFEPLLTT